MFPLNYVLHRHLLPVYFDTQNPKSLLSSSFHQDFKGLQGFSDKVLGLKPAFQLAHLIKSVYTEHLPKEDFSS